MTAVMTGGKGFAGENFADEGFVSETILCDGERIDDLQRDGRKIIQHPGRFCFGMDAVLLSAYAKASAGDSVIDLCTGTGVIPILMESRYPGSNYLGIELQEESADMARRSVLLNGREQAIQIRQGDVRAYKEIARAGSADVVTVNPPYAKVRSGRQNATDAYSIARHEICCTLADVLRCAAYLLRSGGRFYMVHRPERLAEILSEMHAARIEPKRMTLVYPRQEREPNIVLIEGLRDGAPGMRIAKPLYIYDEAGQYTDEVRRIYEAGGVER